MRNYAKLCETIVYLCLYFHNCMFTIVFLILRFYYCIFTIVLLYSIWSGPGALAPKPNPSRSGPGPLAPQDKTKPVRPRTLCPPSQNQAGPAQVPLPLALWWQFAREFNRQFMNNKFVKLLWGPCPKRIDLIGRRAYGAHRAQDLYGRAKCLRRPWAA